jgi:hypothetical protein
MISTSSHKPIRQDIIARSVTPGRACLSGNRPRRLTLAVSLLKDTTERQSTADEERRDVLNARMALVANDEERVTPLKASLLSATPAYLGDLVDVLAPCLS